MCLICHLQDDGHFVQSNMLTHLPWTKWPPFRRRHFQMHFCEWKVLCILIPISLRFVLKVPIDNKSALVQAMAWHRIGDKPLPEPLSSQFTVAYMRHRGRWVNYPRMFLPTLFSSRTLSRHRRMRCRGYRMSTQPSWGPGLRACRNWGHCHLFGTYRIPFTGHLFIRRWCKCILGRKWTAMCEAFAQWHSQFVTCTDFVSNVFPW